jgi:hypothetical protein
MVVGVTGNGWGLDAAKDTATLFKNFRFDNESSEPTSDYTNQGVKLNVLFPGPYSSGGVSSLNASTWVSNALSWYKANCTPANCPSIEILNEPGGTWFWGSSALSTTNAMAYVNLLKLVNSQFTATYGSSRPKIIASYDGSNGLQWGRTVWSVDSTVGNYVDGISVHPYGGNSNVTASALGNRQMVIDAHNETNKPVYVTEVGWPTAVGQPSTGDSLQWTEGSQATNIYNFLTWAKGTGYVPAVYLFNYRDYGTNNWYGVERWQQNNGTILGSKKPSWTAISQWLQGQTCTVCQ